MKPQPQVGQEWVKRVRHVVRGRSGKFVKFTTTRIRIVDWRRSGNAPWNRGEVESLMPSGEWGRRRSILLSALSNTPSGYNLVKEAP